METLEDLRSQASEEAIKRIFTEYLLELIGKAGKLDEIITLVEQNGTLKQIKELL